MASLQCRSQMYSIGFRFGEKAGQSVGSLPSFWRICWHTKATLEGTQGPEPQHLVSQSRDPSKVCVIGNLLEQYFLCEPKKNVFAYKTIVCERKNCVFVFCTCNSMCKIQVGKWSQLCLQPLIGCLCTHEFFYTPAMAIVLQIRRVIQMNEELSVAFSLPSVLLQ